MTIDLATDPLGTGRDGRAVQLADIWPSAEQVAAAVTLGGEGAPERLGRDGWSDIDPPSTPTPWTLDPATVQRPPIEAATPPAASTTCASSPVRR